METVLQAKNMTKIYGLGSKQPFTALENIDLEIKAGEFIVVMGASGSGKSTLVNNISTIDMPTKGNLYILNQEVKQMSENQLGKFRYQYLGFVFQNYNLLNSLTVYENIAYGLKIKKALAPKLDKEGKQIVDIDYGAIKKLEKEKTWIQKNDPNNLEDLENIDHDIEEYKNNKIPLMVKRKLNKKEIDEKVLKAAEILNLTDLLY